MDIICTDSQPRDRSCNRTAGGCAERPGARVMIIIFPIHAIGGRCGPSGVMPTGPDLKPLGCGGERFDGKADKVERTALCGNDAVRHPPARSTGFGTSRAEAADAAG